MILPLDGAVVSRVAFDHAITLSMDYAAELRLETRFTLTVVHDEVAVEPSDASSNAGVLVGLLHRRVDRLVLHDTGQLHLVVEGDVRIDVAPHQSFEAWTFVGPGHERAVCLPGGGLATWGLSYGAGP